jgi:hypothetical protein
MLAPAVRKSHAHNCPLDAESGLPRPSKHHATCAWCRRDCRSIIELIDHVDATHLDQSDTGSEASAICLTEEL